MKFDSLFSRGGGFSRHRQEPQFKAPHRPGLPAVPDDFTEPLTTPLSGRTGVGPSIDPRNMSPRKLAEWAHDLYLCRMLDWDEYCLAGFPAELHPHYNRTVGALTGAPAQPDAPRDMVRVWEEKRAFALRYNPPDSPEVQRAEKLLRLLRLRLPPKTH